MVEQVPNATPAEEEKKQAPKVSHPKLSNKL